MLSQALLRCVHRLFEQINISNVAIYMIYNTLFVHRLLEKLGKISGQ